MRDATNGKSDFSESANMHKMSLLMMIAATVLLSACNTFQGIGKDIEKGGEAIQKATK